LTIVARAAGARALRPGARSGPNAAVAARSRATPIATRMNVVITVGSFVMRVLARLFTRPDRGRRRRDPRSGAILSPRTTRRTPIPCSSGIPATALGRPLNWLGKREVFEWPVLVARPARRRPPGRPWGGRRRGLPLGDADSRGRPRLAVFPEGTRSPDGRLQAAKDGVAVLALRSGALVVPIGVGDSERLWPKGRFIPRFTRSVSVRIGEPVRLAEAVAAADPAAAADRRRAKEAGTDLIMRRIAALLPARQRGAYGDEPAG
jgi:1-acyl-sn-glycerol-3-phosphate acyltransferase